MVQHISRDKLFYARVFSLSAPMIILNLVNSSKPLLDTFMVGSLGEEYLSGMTLAIILFFAVEVIVFGLLSGSAVLISQYHGKGDNATINHVIGICLKMSIAVSTLVALALTFFPAQVYSLTSNDTDLIAIAAEYGRIAAFSLVLNAISMTYISAQRSMGNPRLGMIILSISVSTHLFLNWVLIFGNLGMPALGVKGAALAMLISRIIEFTITVGYALRTSTFKLQLQALIHPGKVIFKDFMRYAMPVVAGESLWGIGYSMYAIIFGHMENAVAGVAAYTIILNIERTLSSVYYALGAATGILVGREMGAGRRDDALNAGVTLLALTGVFGVFAGLLVLALSHTVILPFIFPLFRASQLTHEAGASLLLIMSLYLPFRAFNFSVIVGALRGGGDVRASMFIETATMYLIALPLTALMGLVFHTSMSIVYLMICMEEFTKFALGIWRISRKKWLRNVTQTNLSA